MMNSIGLDTIGQSDQISKAMASGIKKFLRLIFDAFAVVNTGARIRATTAGRMPINMRVRVSLFFIVSGVRNMAMKRMMRNDGRIGPNAAMMLPFSPVSLLPTDMATCTAMMPGSEWEMGNN